MTRIILSGCNGKMGQVITDILKDDTKAVIVAGIDIKQNIINSYPVFQNFSKCNVEADVIIDFSSPVNLDNMLDYAIKNRIGCVLCTTGYSTEQLQLINEAAQRIPVLRSANM